MYSQFFGLKQAPFSISPDPRFLFMSERHREALAHLLYGLDGGGGFVLLSGEIGAGKTTVCRCFLEQIPKRCNVAYIFNPELTVVELLRSVCDEFHIPLPHAGPAPATVKDHVDPLNQFLLKTHAVGQNNVLIIDEAQNLSADVLEQLRLLTNLETNERKLLQIVLIGQPELREMLARPELEQLAQRVIARFHLGALSQAETAQYIRHRLSVAGLRGAVPFDQAAWQRIHQLARGVPRRINLLCDRALLGAYAGGQTKVDRRIVERAAEEVFGPAETATAARARHRRAAWAGAGVVAGAALVGGITLTVNGGPRQSAPVAVATSASASALAAATAASKPASAAPAKGAAAGDVAAAPAASAAAAALFLTPSDLQTAFKLPLRNEADAWRELAPMWNLTLGNGNGNGDGDPCLAARRSQVHCFRSNSNLALMRQLGRPGILTLRFENGKPEYALLTGLTNQSATLRAGAVAQTVSLASLASVWRGEFATFWRAPPDYRDRLVDGSGGAMVNALAAQLAKLNGQAAPTAPQAFDAVLKSKLSAFQLTQGLSPDGVAGPTTFMQLNRATGVDEPRLQTDPPPPTQR